MLTISALIVLSLVLVSIIIFLVIVISSIQDRLKKLDQRLNQFAGQLDGVLRDANTEARLTASEFLIERRTELRDMEKNVGEQMVKLTNLTVRARVMLQDFIMALRDDKNTKIFEIEDTLEEPKPGSYQAWYNEEMNKAYEEGDRSK